MGCVEVSMFYANIKEYAPEKFKRLTGVRKETFALMVDALVQGFNCAFGRPPTLCLEDRLLLTLMYWREYRTQEHIGETIWRERSHGSAARSSKSRTC